MATKLNSPEIDKATPRPWALDGNKDSLFIVAVAETLPTVARATGVTREQAQANAKLIVTAVNSYGQRQDIADERVREAHSQLINAIQALDDEVDGDLLIKAKDIIQISEMLPVRSLRDKMYQFLADLYGHTAHETRRKILLEFVEWCERYDAATASVISDARAAEGKE